MTSNILALTVALMILPAPVIYYLGKKMGKRVGWVAFGILLLSALIFTSLFPAVMKESLLEEYAWTTAPVALKFGFMGDGLSIPMIFTFIFVFAFAALFSMPYMERRFAQEDMADNPHGYGTYFALFLFYAGCVGGAMLSTNLIEFYLFFESALVASWLLVLFYGYGERSKNSIMYFIWTHIGGGALLLGILGASWITGSFEVADLWNIGHSSGAFWVGIAITLGLFVKIGAMGLHGWMPTTYSESPAPVSAVLGATSVMLSTYALSRFIVPFKEVLFGVSGLLMLWALVTILYAGLMALVQTDTKRLVAFLSMSQMNYCVLGIFTFAEFGVLGAISYSISHGLAIALLFLVSGALLYKTDTRDMTKMGGLAEKLPTAIIAAIIGFLTIGGIPPAVGFKSKFILLTGAFVRGFETTNLELMIAILAGSLATIITIAYEFRTVWRVFYGKIPDKLREITTLPKEMAVTLLVLSALSVLLGLWPKLITDPIELFIMNVFGHGVH